MIRDQTSDVSQIDIQKFTLLGPPNRISQTIEGREFVANFAFHLCKKCIPSGFKYTNIDIEICTKSGATVNMFLDVFPNTRKIYNDFHTRFLQDLFVPNSRYL